MPARKKILVVQVAALGADFARRNGYGDIAGLPLQEAKTLFPAVTCTVSASFRTGLLPSVHGIPGNGWLDSSLREPCFWKQSSQLVEGERIWDGARKNGATVAVAFLQQILGERADAVLSPAPIHKHGGGMEMACYSKPSGFYTTLKQGAGGDFKLWRYWGPLASVKSSHWIASGFAGYLKSPDAADFVWFYLPGLDYDLQRFGPSSSKCAKAMAATAQDLEMVCASARSAGYETVVFGDYAMEDVTFGVSYPNRKLLEAGLFKTRTVAGMEYPDLFDSPVFAVCDHQVAHVYVFDKTKLEEAVSIFESDSFTDRILRGEERTDAGLNHARAGDFTIVAKPGAWYSYKWWTSKRSAPDYASHVDIHNKPGFDPCELFFAGANPFNVSQDDAKVKGTHGRSDAGVAVYSSLGPVGSLLELSNQVKEFLEK